MVLQKYKVDVIGNRSTIISDHSYKLLMLIDINH